MCILMSIPTKKINTKRDLRQAKGSDICPVCYVNMFLVSPTDGGKTTCVFDILKSCVGPETEKVILMCSSMYNDEKWEYIRDWLERAGIEVEEYLSMNDGGINHLKELVNNLQIEAKEEKERKRKEVEQNGEREQTLAELIDFLYHRERIIEREQGT